MPAPAAPAIQAAANPAPVALPSFADLVARVRPAVVTITTTARQAGDEGRNSPFPSGSEGDRSFGRFFGERGGGGGSRTVHALGSGFLIDGEGHIVTNNHVVQNATQVRVSLSDGREMPAQVVGRDPRTDLALLKVSADGPLPHLDLGDSDRERPGDWVVAVGNPFGLGGTVTAGVVSARGRDIGSGPYDDYLQIDAPINSGNSGGPLFATDGSVVGVNTAIYSPSGGSVGIGFAIPSNIVKQVVAQLQANGRVDRGYLGATTQAVTPTLAQALRLAEQRGALVDDVDPNGPAARAGLRPGDVITALNGADVASSRDLARAVGDARPGSEATLAVLRDGTRRDLRVTLSQLVDKGATETASQAAEQPRGAIGIAVTSLDDSVRQELNLPRGLRGAVVAGVRPESPAAEAGLRPGDVITDVGGRDVADAQGVVRAISDGARTGAVALRIVRDGQGLFVAVPTATG
ncbi:Do family serine endopeptidase [Roseomonas sp. CCTCC AB2023176]|uniref:Do family serine endopeptidase n=1 Tax=Roseomonas sp. CCTCC AB2023176 TaxID=3342640 RepID=UPI0035D8EC73